MRRRRNQSGLYLLEFAIIAVVLIITLFAAIELARLIWVWNTADEATRRGARVAAVCPINDTAVPEVTVFAAPGAGPNSPVLNGLTTSNVSVSYLESDGVTTTTTFEDVRYVRVSINCPSCPKYSISPIIPFLNTQITLPEFETTLPSESLGFIPNDADPFATPVCGCFGSTGSC